MDFDKSDIKKCIQWLKLAKKYFCAGIDAPKGYIKAKRKQRKEIDFAIRVLKSYLSNH